MLKFSRSFWLTWDPKQIFRCYAMASDFHLHHAHHNPGLFPTVITSHGPTSRSSTRSCLQEKYHAQCQQQYPAWVAIISPTSTEQAKHQEHARNVTIWLMLVMKHSHNQEGFTDTQPTMPPGNSWQRNVRSKFWWFSRSCNSHYVSHFAAFFIIVETKTSIAESCKTFLPCRTLLLGVTRAKTKTW